MANQSNTCVSYSLQDGVAVIQMDDGKRNALPPERLAGLNAALDRALADRVPVVITGREGTFSAGYDLKIVKAGGWRGLGMLVAGYSLTARLLAHPYPVVMACNGHSLAMGVFLMVSGDYVIGTRGDGRISANEVELGMNMPRVGAAVLRQRLAPHAFQSAVNLAKCFSTEEALAAGFFDELVDAPDLLPRAYQLARQLGKLDMRAHAATKRAVRASVIRRIRWSIPLDLAYAVRHGVRAMLADKGSRKPAA